MPVTVQRSPVFNDRTGQRAAPLVAADGRAAQRVTTDTHTQVLWLNLAMMAGQCRSTAGVVGVLLSWSCRRLIAML
jgi:hypothetical protein